MQSPDWKICRQERTARRAPNRKYSRRSILIYHMTHTVPDFVCYCLIIYSHTQEKHTQITEVNIIPSAAPLDSGPFFYPVSLNVSTELHAPWSTRHNAYDMARRTREDTGAPSRYVLIFVSQCALHRAASIRLA